MGNTSPDNIVYPDAVDRVGDIQPDFVALAASTQAAFTDLRADVNAELNDFYNMPTPVTRVGADVQAITATGWANIPNIANISFNFSRPCWVEVTFGAWVIASAGDIRGGINVSGATSQAPNVPAWGNTIYQTPGLTTGTASQQCSKIVLCSAGTTTFTAQAYQSGGGTKRMNYSMLQAIPLYYNTAMPGGV